MTTQTQYKTLKAGDIRQLDDEFRHNGDGKVPRGSEHISEHHNGKWYPVHPTRLGELILEADLIVTEYRRALE